MTLLARSVVGGLARSALVVIVTAACAAAAGCGQKGPLTGARPTLVPAESGASAVPPPAAVAPR